MIHYWINLHFYLFFFLIFTKIKPFMVFGIPEKQKESTERKFNSFFRKREKTSLSTKVEKEKKNATEGHGAYLVNFFNDSD